MPTLVGASQKPHQALRQVVREFELTGRLQALVDRDVIGSRRALALASNPGRFLSTVQVGITLVGVWSGALSGATLGLRLPEWFTRLGLPAVAVLPIGTYGRPRHHSATANE